MFKFSTLWKIYDFLNTGLICVPEVLIRCKVKGREFMIQLIYELIGTKSRQFMNLLMYSNKLAYLELITVLVYGKVLPVKVI